MEKVPVFSNLLEALKLLVNDDVVNPLHPNTADIDKSNELITHLQLIEVIAPHLHDEYHEKIFSLLPHLTILLRHPLKAVSIFWGMTIPSDVEGIYLQKIVNSETKKLVFMYVQKKTSHSRGSYQDAMFFFQSNF